MNLNGTRSNNLAQVRRFMLPGCALTLLMVLLGHSNGTAAAPSLRWNQLASLPDRQGLAGAFAGVSSGVLLVGGGANFPGKKLWEGGEKVWHDTVYALGQPSGTWSVLGKLPRPLAYGIPVTSGEQIVCIGGSDARQHYQDVFALAFVAGQLKIIPLPSLPIPMAYGAGVMLNRVVYVCGGSEQPGEKSALNRLYALNQAQTRWEELEPCPGKPRVLPVMAAVGDSFYLAGGSAIEDIQGKPARVPLRDTWKYQPGRGWFRLADLPRPSVAAPSPAPVVDATFLIIGGDDGSLAGFKPVEKHPGFSRNILGFDTRSGRWTDMGETPAPRATVTAVPWGDSIVIPSGEVRPGVRSPEVWAMKPGATPTPF